jgi:hypothetical protein
VTPQQVTAVTAVGQVIQLAVAPVFLLSAIGALMVVLTNRLARVIDRARLLEAQLPAAAEGGPSPGLQRELDTLSQRAMLVHRAITLCVVTAVLVCGVIVALFLGAFVEIDVSVMVALLFIGAMLAFVGGLLTLMRELFMATASLRFGKR